MADWFVTGAQGCIGAWVVKLLLARGERPFVFDKSEDTQRLRLVLEEEELARVRFQRGDVTELAAVRAALEASGAEHVVHLAGLQVPFCKAEPPLGAAVNVVGTVNVFEAVKALGLNRVAYASSAAVYGDFEEGVAVDEETPCDPATHYGVFKRANEGNARVYWLDDEVQSVGLRPLTVYGVARDQGLTSGPTRAMKAAVLGRDYTIPFTGTTDFLYARDAAAAFIAAAEGGPRGAHVFNLHGDAVRVQDVIEQIDAHAEEGERGRVSCEGPPLPIASTLDGSAFRGAYPDLATTSLADGVRETMQRFRALHARDLLTTSDLD